MVVRLFLGILGLVLLHAYSPSRLCAQRADVVSALSGSYGERRPDGPASFRQPSRMDVPPLGLCRMSGLCGKEEKLQMLSGPEKADYKLIRLQKLHDRNERIIRKQWFVISGMFAGLLFLGGTSLLIYRQKQKVTCLYRTLFAVNKELMDAERYNRELRLKYEAQIRQKDLCMQHMRERYAAEYVEAGAEGEKQKYVGSRLNREQKTSLAAAIACVMENTLEFCETDFSLDKLAALVNSNSTYVSQVINETYRKNFSMFVNEYRIREARKRLADSKTYGNYTIKTIAESVGFRSQTTFIKMFREFTGMTPSLFQKIQKNEEE